MLLSEEQKQSLEVLDGPIMILAGAGSGKTKVLVERVKILLQNNSPQSILILTFSNKACSEIQERLNTFLEISTFHSFCVKLLRKEFFEFSIYDEKDSKKLVDELLVQRKEKHIFQPYDILSYIELEKNKGSSLKRLPLDHTHHYYSYFIEYEKILIKNKALDFSGLITKAIDLLEDNIELKKKYNTYYKYIFVDEYQDTNTAQFILLKHLREFNQNLCVVGDEDQSIYSWRGANIHNILNFENTFPNSSLFKLQENFRSTQYILEAANYLIQNNKERKDKYLFTHNTEENPIELASCFDEISEANFVVNTIKTIQQKFKNFAIIYRNNILSRYIEDALRRNKMQYRVYGGIKFYDRKEIKDIIAYLKLTFNPADDLSFKRIFNTPKRGFGKVFLDKLLDVQKLVNKPLYSIIEDFPLASKAYKEKLSHFFQLIKNLQELSLQNVSLEKMVNFLLSQTKFLDSLKEEKDGAEKAQHVQELLFLLKTSSMNLEEFLEQADLYKGSEPTESVQVELMTIHAAKGLEFDVVFMIGLENNVFPSYQSLLNNNIEEERRLFYVAMTRARKKLYFTYSKSRNLYGQTQYQQRSLFIDEIPKKYYSEQKVY